ncbi:MAG TPA: methyltransferase type 11 [Mucilaginibacter sp.]|jgi:hypothetical protein
MTTVEIFRTNVNCRELADKVLKTLRTNLPHYLFNFDLEDCDCILRVESAGVPIEIARIIKVVEADCVKISLFED